MHVNVIFEPLILLKIFEHMILTIVSVQQKSPGSSSVGTVLVVTGHYNRPGLGLRYKLTLRYVAGLGCSEGKVEHTLTL